MVNFINETDLIDYQNELISDDNNDDYVSLILNFNKKFVDSLLVGNPVEYEKHYKILRTVLNKNNRKKTLKRKLYFEIGHGYLDSMNLSYLLNELKNTKKDKESINGIGVGLIKYYTGLKISHRSIQSFEEQKDKIASELMNSTKLLKENDRDMYLPLWKLLGETAGKEEKKWIIENIAKMKATGAGRDITTGLAENVDADDIQNILESCDIENGNGLDEDVYNLRYFIKVNSDKIMKNSNNKLIKIAYLFGISEGIIKPNKNEEEDILKDNSILLDPTCAKWMFFAMNKGNIGSKSDLKRLFSTSTLPEIKYLYGLYGYDQKDLNQTR